MTITSDTAGGSVRSRRRRVVVVGAGVVGLTTAVVLAEAGHEVTVLADEPSEASTSAVAGALWGPWLVEPRSLVLDLAADTLRALNQLAGDADSGVRVATVREVAAEQYESVDWAPLVTDCRACRSEELPAGYTHGVTYTAPLVTMDIHLPYLGHRARTAGVVFRREYVEDLATLDGQAEVIVNATGMGARDLVPDPTVYPIQGHHVIVTNPGLTDVLEADTNHPTDLIAIYPHGDVVILGGTARPHEWSRTPDPAVAEAILHRCRRIEPRLNDAEIVDHRVGLRPTRPQLRIETTTLADRALLVHAYGHGGAGVSLAWGTAHHIADQLTSWLT